MKQTPQKKYAALPRERFATRKIMIGGFKGRVGPGPSDNEFELDPDAVSALDSLSISLASIAASLKRIHAGISEANSNLRAAVDTP